MGASNSAHTRTVTIDNESAIGVIDVSDAVVQRLKGGLTAKGTNTQSAKENSTPSSYPNAAKRPTNLYSEEPTLTSGYLLRQKEAELKNNDLYWTKRMQELEKSLEKTNSILESEYNQTVENVKKQFANAPKSHQLPICRDVKTDLIQCYQTNSNQTLKCAEHVTKFNACVNSTA